MHTSVRNQISARPTFTQITPYMSRPTYHQVMLSPNALTKTMASTMGENRPINTKLNTTPRGICLKAGKEEKTGTIQKAGNVLGGKELREAGQVWRGLAASEVRLQLMKVMKKEDLAFNDVS